MFPVPIPRPFGLFPLSIADIIMVELRWCWLGILAVPWLLWVPLEVVSVDILLH